MDLNLFDRLPRRYGLNRVEAITLLYTLFTAVLTLLLWERMAHPFTILSQRLFILAALAGWWGLYHVHPCRFTLLLRYIFPLSLLSFWYPDTYSFCCLFPNLDHLFAAADQWLFGCQPAVTFSAWLSSRFWSELFYLGYFAYYPMIALTVLLPLCRGDIAAFKRTAFIVLGAFFCYYLIYLFLPVAGPQFYFPAIPAADLHAGIFPELGDYFRLHPHLPVASADEGGLFHTLVTMAQEGGERPTAAFPSSHVGMSTILILLLWRDERRLMWWCLPFYIVLCASTVYIRAHYLVDVLGGLVTALAFYALMRAVHRRIRPHEAV